jgi:hypothetical protein
MTTPLPKAPQPGEVMTEFRTWVAAKGRSLRWVTGVAVSLHLGVAILKEHLKDAPPIAINIPSWSIALLLHVIQAVLVLILLLMMPGHPRAGKNRIAVRAVEQFHRAWENVLITRVALYGLFSARVVADAMMLNAHGTPLVPPPIAGIFYSTS